MSEIKSRVIIINADDAWTFRDLVSCYALDLYPLDSGVDFFDVIETGAAEVGRDRRSYQGVIGNFPEDYSTEPDTLLEEIDETIVRLAKTGNERTYLALALVINKRDLEALAVSRDRDTPALSSGAMNGYKAFLRAMTAVEAQGDKDDANVVGRMSTRVWFSLIVRDAGANAADLRLGQKAQSLVKQGRVELQNLFFLSEGRGQDALDSAQDRHFAKLRLLIDIFSQSHTDEVQKNLRASNMRDFGTDTSKLMWLRTTESDHKIFANADVIRRGLVSRFLAFTNKESQERGENWPSAFSGIKKTINGILPGLKDEKRAGDMLSDAYTQETALNAVVTAAKNTDLERRDDNDKGQDAEILLQEHMAAMRRRKKGLFYDAKAPARIQQTATEYNASLNQSRDVFEAAVSTVMDELRAEHEQKRLDLHANLETVELPATQDALQDLHAYRERVLEDSAETANESIADARVSYVKNDAISDKAWDKMSAERSTAVGRLLQRQERLLRRGSAALVVLLVTAVALIPILAVPLVRCFKGVCKFNSVQDILGPMGWIMLVNVVFTSGFAIWLAYGLAKKRNKEAEKVAVVMGNHYDRLRLSYAGLLRIAVNRWRLSLLNTVLRFLQPQKGISTQEPAEQFISKLAAMQSSHPASAMAVSEKTTQILEEAFKRGATPAERITSVLVANLPKPETPPRLLITPGHFGATEFTLATSASPETLKLTLGVVGNE